MIVSQSNIVHSSHNTSAGPFYLTKLLIPLLKATAEKSPAGTVRVTNVSSIAHYMAAKEGIRFSTLGPDPDGEAAAGRRKLGMARVYGQSKLVKSMIPMLIRHLSKSTNREIFCSRTNSLNDTKTMGLFPSPISQVPSMQISRVTQATFSSVPCT